MPNTHSLYSDNYASKYVYITDAAQTGLDLTTTLSIEAWIRFDTGQLPGTTLSACSIVNKYGGLGRAYKFYVGVSGAVANKLGLFLSDDGSNTVGHFLSFGGSTAFNVNTWYHVAVTFDVATETCVMYVNGVAETVSLLTGTTFGSSIYNTADDLIIGQYLGGYWDEVRVWNDIRTATEIENNYQTELVGNEANLVAYWKFNNSALDETSNNNDLTLVNSPTYSTTIPDWGGEPPATVIKDMMGMGFIPFPR